MTQEELDALLNESVLDTMEDGSANKEEKAEARHPAAEDYLAKKKQKLKLLRG